MTHREPVLPTHPTRERSGVVSVQDAIQRALSAYLQREPAAAWRDPGGGDWRTSRADFVSGHAEPAPLLVPEPVPLRRAQLAPGAHLGRILRRMRTDRQLSQTAVARALGVDASYVSKLEAGTIQLPSPTLIEKLSDVLGMDSEVFYNHAGVVSPHLVRFLTKSRLALKFTQEVSASELSTVDWAHLLGTLRKLQRDNPRSPHIPASTGATISHEEVMET